MKADGTRLAGSSSSFLSLSFSPLPPLTDIVMSTMSYTYTTTLDTDDELSRLIGTLRLNTKDSESTSQDLSKGVMQVDEFPRGSITSRPECQSHPNTTSHSHVGPFGCPLLLSIHYHIEVFPTTGGAYLDTIFTHRTLFHASPRDHEQCGRAFSDLARQLDDREWRADRESDQEAVAAFLQEAMSMGSLY